MLFQMMSLSHTFVTFEACNTFTAVTLSRLCITALGAYAIHMAVARLATAIRILHRIAKIARVTMLA